MDFELVLSSMFFFFLKPKIAFIIYCTMDNAGPYGAIFISLTAVILHGQKVVRCVQFYCTRGYFSKANNACNKMLRLALEYPVRYKLSIWSIIFQFLRWSDFCSKFYKV